MGFVTVTAQIGATAASMQEMQFMVDTGAFYTFLPPEVCDGLGISPCVKQ